MILTKQKPKKRKQVKTNSTKRHYKMNKKKKIKKRIKLSGKNSRTLYCNHNDIGASRICSKRKTFPVYCVGMLISKMRIIRKKIAISTE